MRKFGLIWAIVLGLAVCGNARAAQQEITVCSFGGTYNQGLAKIFGEPFTKATGIKVNFTTLPTFAQIQAQAKSGDVVWDIVECESRMFARGSKAKLFEPVDLSHIHAGDFVPGAVKKDGVGICFYSFNICYNTKKWPAGKGPESLKDFFDTKRFPGPRSVYYSPLSSLEGALRADGVPWAKIYPIDVDRAFKKLNQIKPDIRVYYKSGGQAQQIMENGEVDMGLFPGGRMIQAQRDGLPVHIVWNDELVDLDYWAIPKGCKHLEAARRFITFMADPKRQAAFAKWTLYGPANRKAFQYIDAKTARLLPTNPKNLARGAIVDQDWYAEHEASVQKRWETWKMQ
ncbi:MAG: ABC transporter substrate-binding protein [Syntrophobacteraceae bacterium]